MITSANPVKNIEATQKQIESSYRELKSAADKIFDEVSSLQHIISEQINYFRKQNPYIVKSVLRYIAAGVDKKSAVNLTAQDYSTSVERVEAIYQSSRRYISAANLYAKRYTCEKLRAAGFKIKDIAAIVGVSENHVYKLLKSEIDL